MAEDENRKPRTGEDEAALLRDLRAASIGTHAAELRAIYRMKQGLGDDCDEGCSPKPCGPPAADDIVASVSDLVFEAAKLQLEGYNGLLKIGAEHGDRLMRALRDRLRARRVGGAAARCEVLEIVGTAGIWTDPKAFCILNRLRRPAKIEFRVGEFSDVHGPGRPFHGETEFHADPPVADPTKERDLAPGESRVFVMRIRLVGPFTAGHRYAGSLEICSGGCVLEERSLRVQVR